MNRPTISRVMLSGVTTVVAACLSGYATAGCSGCTGGCRECVPACHGTWDEKTSSKPVYTMTCEYACARERDAWHAPDPACRCHPPCGRVIVKKKFSKTDGPEKVERVPKYEVRMVPAAPVTRCDHGRCDDPDRLGWWSPFAWLHRCASWW